MRSFALFFCFADFARLSATSGLCLLPVVRTRKQIDMSLRGVLLAKDEYLNGQVASKRNVLHARVRPWYAFLGLGLGGSTNLHLQRYTYHVVGCEYIIFHNCAMT